jgi:hypothetical protein
LLDSSVGPGETRQALAPRSGGNGRLVLGALAILLSGTPAGADSLSRGSVSLEARAFNPDDEENTEDYGTALTTKLEITYEKKPLSAELRGVARFDALDNTRNIGDLESAYVMYSTGRFAARVGVAILNWSATEAFHPADVINSRNYDGDPENLEKIGEPMVELRLRVLDGFLSAYYMPIRLPSKLNEPGSRLSLLPPELELGDELWIDRDGTVSESAVAHQAAVQISQTIGPADVALHVLDHSDRNQPSYIFVFPNTLRPAYHWVRQVGLTSTVVAGSLILKLEAAKRFFVTPDPPPDPEEDPLVEELADHEVVAVGLEYGWTTDGGYDATVILEGQWLNEEREVAKELDVFQGDALVAYRLAFNDVKAREVRLGIIADVERPSEYVAVARYNQSLTDVWSIAALLQSQRILGTEPVHGLQLTLQRNF